MDNNNIDDLLDHIKGISNYDFNANNDFNIFKILGIERRETYFCRFVGELLNPEGSHGAGRLPLELFFKYVLGIKVIRPEAYWIELEEHTQSGRRVDIVIHNGYDVYPIEVKIGAKDRDLQLSDYYNNYFKNKEGTIYYLTPNGHEPSETSIGTLAPALIQCISFDDLICWLNTLCDYNSFKQKDICRQFRLFANDIKERYNMSEEVIKKIFDTKNTENIRSALAILEEKDNILKKIKEDFLYKLKKIIESIDYADKNEKGRYICDYENDSEEDKFRCLKISKAEKSKNRTVYHICIDHNLYITRDKGSGKNPKWKCPAWTYIDVDGHYFNLKHPKYNVIEFVYGENNDMPNKMKKALESLLNDDLYNEGQ